MMIRIEGVPVVAKRLQEALRSGCQVVPCHGATTADTSARDKFQTGVDMDPGTILAGSAETPRSVSGLEA